MFSVQYKVSQINTYIHTYTQYIDVVIHQYIHTYIHTGRIGAIGSSPSNGLKPNM